MKNSKIKFAVIFLCLVLLSATSFYGGYEVKKNSSNKKDSDSTAIFIQLEAENEFLKKHNEKSDINNTKTIISNDYKKEKVLRCFTAEEAKLLPKNTHIDCIGDCTFLYSEKTCISGIDFAKKLKYLYRNKDIETFANIIQYPVYINGYKGKELKINSKEELLKLDKNIIMNDKIFKAIDENRLFVNWRGFMLGNGDIWFGTDGEISRVTLNLD